MRQHHFLPLVSPIGLALYQLLAIVFFANAEDLYDVSFESPLHTVNLPPATGGREAPSGIYFGQPLVRPSLWDANNACLEFNIPNPSSDFSLEQVGFNLRVGSPRLFLGFDVFTKDLAANSGFRILFDTPNVQTFQLSAGPPGQANLSIDGLLSPVATYPQQQLLHLGVDVDLLAHTWDFYVNGAHLLTGPFVLSGPDVLGIRFSLSANSAGPDALVQIDNVRIAAVPEPATWQFSALGIALILILRCRQRWVARIDS
jgi:hypothetical protein